MVKIISDSTCDLTRELLERYQVTVLPLHVLLGDTEYLDGSNITPDTIYAWSDQNKTTPKTSAPSVAEAVELFRPYAEAGDELICFSISDTMSSSGNSMRLAAQELEAEDRIHVIDSENLSTGVGHLVILAAELAQAGKPAEEIIRSVEAMRPLVRSSFVVDTLVYLHRGGRCGGLTALAGSMLRLHPKIIVENGSMIVGKKYRGKIDKVILNYVQDMEEELKQAREDRIFITHSNCDDATVQAVYDYLDSLQHFKEIFITSTGSVISSHCGPGTLGVLFVA
ncbi:DegV family protein [Butyricicoccus sp.]|uniref:DegV family protein n=1 Tax=Butyricicoccus sp. TaxID=2049021 RepID=UPI003F186909